jgi:glycosyltransferase involved in cell wall biosynthesis
MSETPPHILVVAPKLTASESDQLTERLLTGPFSAVTVDVIRTNFSAASGHPWINVLKNFGALRAAISEIRAFQKKHQPAALAFIPRDGDPLHTLPESLLLRSVRREFPKTILHLQEPGFAAKHEQLTGLAKKFFQQAFARPDLVILTSQAAHRDAEILEARQAVAAPIGVPDAWPDGPRRERNMEPFLLCMGTISEENGLGILLDASKLLLDRGYKFRGRIVGEAPSPEVLAGFKEQAATLGNIFTFSNPVFGDARWDLMAESDIFCSLPHRGTRPDEIEVLQAMMSGLPVLASNWQSLPEIVADGKSGFVAPAADAKAASDRLAKLLKDQLLRQIMGNSGRNRYLDHFTMEAFQQRWESAVG